MNAKDVIRANLKRYMKQAGKTQAGLAEHLGVTQSAVSNWIRGKNSIDVEYVPGICSYLGITVGELFGADAPPDVTAVTYAYISLDEQARAEVRAFIDLYSSVRECVRLRRLPNSTRDYRRIDATRTPPPAQKKTARRDLPGRAVPLFRFARV